MDEYRYIGLNQPTEPEVRVKLVGIEIGNGGGIYNKGKGKSREGWGSESVGGGWWSARNKVQQNREVGNGVVKMLNTQNGIGMMR